MNFTHYRSSTLQRHWWMLSSAFFALISLGHSDGEEVMCFQGSLVTDKNSKISLSQESLSHLEVSACKLPTTTMPPPTTTLPTTTMGTTAMTTELVTDMTTTGPNVTSPVASTKRSTAKPTTTTVAAGGTTTPVAATPTPAEPTTAPPSTEALTTAGLNTTAQSAAPGSRGKRALDIPAVDEPQFYCHASYAPTSSTGSKLTVNSTYTLRFYCKTAVETEDSCKNSNGTWISHEKSTGTYCCKGDHCNTPTILIKNTQFEVKKVSNCNHYDETDTRAIPCIQSANPYFCFNQTTGAGDKSWNCGYETFQQMYCSENGWFAMDQCSEANGTTTCCYYQEAAPPPPPATATPKETPTKGGKGGFMSTFVIILVTFSTGIFVGCVLLVFVQRKCRKRQGSDDLMDFSYSRFQSAENSTNEL